MAKEYFRRIAVCFVGLIFYGLGNACGVMAGSVGTNAWNTLSIGLADSLGWSFGAANFSISLIVIVAVVIGKGKIGVGTILNIVVISLFSELWIGLLRLLPASDSRILGVAYSLLGQCIISFSIVIYMRAELGCGPRDGLMVLLGRRLPGIPIGAVKFGIELIVLGIGVLLGAPFGIGTVLVMALQASIFQLVCRICRFEPRSLRHENVLDTLRRIAGRKAP